MIYNTVNSRQVVARIQNNYTINSADWINSCPLWINSCMADMKAFPQMQQIDTVVEVSNHIAKLPCHIKALDGIAYNGYILPCMNRQIGRHQDMVSEYPIHTYHAYELRGDNYVTTTFEEGEITFYHKALSVEQDPNTGVWFPLIPDQDEVFIAMEHYILIRIMQKGYKVMMFNLESLSPAINPFWAYYGSRERQVPSSRKKATNSMINLDRDTMKYIADLNITLLHDYNDYQHQLS